MFNARSAAEHTLRESYGRLIALLTRRTHDLAAAEDALGDAFAIALAQWPALGVPTNPDAWLLTVARNKLRDQWRSHTLHATACDTLHALADEYVERDPALTFPDERLRLMFVCAHPAIAAAVRSPLMLQVVLGLDVARMAGAFLSSPTSLAQRLVRAKQKIKDAGIPFEVPARDELPARLQDVLDGIYVAYGTGWDDIDGTEYKYAGLTEEALQLGAAMVMLMPAAAEPLGLLALMLFCDARTAARRAASGDYVPLSEQDTREWDQNKIATADALLIKAAAIRDFGPYQLEAAIQSAHCQRRRGSPVAPAALLALYDRLVELRPSLGAWVSRASAVAAAHGVERGLAALAEIPPSLHATYQPYWALYAHLLALDEQNSAAELAFDRAIALATSASVKHYLWQRRAGLASRHSASENIGS